MKAAFVNTNPLVHSDRLLDKEGWYALLLEQEEARRVVYRGGHKDFVSHDECATPGIFCDAYHQEPGDRFGDHRALILHTSGDRLYNALFELEAVVVYVEYWRREGMPSEDLTMIPVEKLILAYCPCADPDHVQRVPARRKILVDCEGGVTMMALFEWFLKTGQIG